MDLHQSLDLGFEGFCEGVHVLTGVFIPKADAEGAFGLCIGKPERKERRGYLFGVGGASRALRYANSVRRQGVEHGLALDIGKGQIDDMGRAVAAWKIQLQAKR